MKAGAKGGYEPLIAGLVCIKQSGLLQKMEIPPSQNRAQRGDPVMHFSKTQTCWHYGR
jgi:hypothetical protein